MRRPKLIEIEEKVGTFNIVRISHYHREKSSAILQNYILKCRSWKTGLKVNWHMGSTLKGRRFYLALSEPMSCGREVLYRINVIKTNTTELEVLGAFRDIDLTHLILGKVRYRGNDKSHHSHLVINMKPLHKVMDHTMKHKRRGSI